jgi:hypothetical protein
VLSPGTRLNALFVLLAQCILLATMRGCTGETVTLGQIPVDVEASLPEDAGSDAPSAADAEDAGSDASPDTHSDAEAVRVPCFGDAAPVSELVTEFNEENPTLTENLLEIYFSSDDPAGLGSSDVWHASRASISDPFGPPEMVRGISSSDAETSPAISRDGLTLWVARKVSETDTGYDIYRSTRATLNDPWPAPQLDFALSSNADDIPRPLGNNNCTMPLGSRRAGGDYLTYLAECSPAGFYSPVLIESLYTPGRTTVDGFLTDDGLTLYFQQSVSGKETGDLYLTTRPSLGEGFLPPIPLDKVNTVYDERDPWLDRDGRWLYFVSDRDGNSRNIYRAPVLDPTACAGDQ